MKLLPCQLFQSTFPRGERRFSSSNFSLGIVFQSTFPRGERLCSNRYDLLHRRFQSTFPRGERPRRWRIRHTADNFNPRSRVGNDGLQGPCETGYAISIHVPAWGTTKRPPFLYQFTLFQSTFPRGERHCRIEHSLNCGNFNPRSRVGNDFSCF